MEELFFELKQKVYEKLDINLDVSDEDLYFLLGILLAWAFTPSFIM